MHILFAFCQYFAHLYQLHNLNNTILLFTVLIMQYLFVFAIYSVMILLLWLYFTNIL
jgi:hypothetical protein